MRKVVRIAANFDANLESIREFMIAHGTASAFSELIDYLFDDAIPNLERFPEMGRELTRVSMQSLQAQSRMKMLEEALIMGDQVREYIAGDYLLLYAIRRKRIYLLAIKHHKQLSFDLTGHWR